MPTLTNVNDNGVVAAILQKVIAPKLNKAYPTKTVLLTEMTRNGKGEEAGISYQVDPMNFANSQIQFSMSASPIIPIGSGYKDAITIDTANLYAFTVTAQPLYVACEVPDFTNAITQQDRGAIVRIFSVLQEGMRDGAKLALNRMMLNDGSGTVSLVASTVTASNQVPVTLDIDRLGTRYLKAGQYINIAGATGGSKGGGTVTQITAINYNTQTLTVADIMTASAAATISYSTQTGGTVTEWQGLGSLIVNTGIVEGLDVTTVPYQEAHIYNTSAPFDPAELIILDTQVETGNPNLYITNVTGWNKGTQSVWGTERTGMGNKAYLDIGYKTFTANGGQTDIVLDRDCPASVYYGIDKSALRYGELQPFGPFGMGGGLMWIPDFPMMIAQMRMSGNIGITKIESCFKYSNFT